MTGWGVLGHVDSARSPAWALDETIRLARAAEDLGFDSFWIAQHRFGDQGGVLPSPLVLLAAVARETTGIRLGTASIAAAFEDPRRLLEDAAVVDALSGGRLQLGLGSGSSRIASRAWGLDHDLRHARHWEVVDALLDGAVRGVGCDAQRHAVVPGTEALAGRIWSATGSEDGIGHTARRGLGLLAGRRAVDARGPGAEDERVAALIARYRAACGPSGRVVVSRPAVVTRDAGLAARFRAGEGALRAGLGQVWRPEWSVVGAPELFVADWSVDPGIAQADHILVHTRPLVVPWDVQLESLRLLAEEVRPNVGRSSAGRPGAGGAGVPDRIAPL